MKKKKKLDCSKVWWQRKVIVDERGSIDRDMAIQERSGNYQTKLGRVRRGKGEWKTERGGPDAKAKRTKVRKGRVE